MKHKYLSVILTLFSITIFGCQTIAEYDSPPAELSELFSQPELDQMLAPIALYPDALLSQVLMAATYPLEVVEASRWSKETGLQGEEAVNAAQTQNWDISIKSLVAFPDLIQLMDEQLSWTRNLGDAFLLQEEQVMETVQLLRRRSVDEGNLESLDHLVVRDEGEVIIVEPREVEVVYVPYYNTRYVYGDWWWYDYPPVYWHHPLNHHYSRVGFSWSIGWHVSSRFYFSFCDWNRWDIVLHHHRWNHGHHRRPVRKDIHYAHHEPDRYDRDDRYRNSNRQDDGQHSGSSNRPDGGKSTAVKRPDIDPMADMKSWQHNPYHRRGVEYRGDISSRNSGRIGSTTIATNNRSTNTQASQRTDIKREDISRTSTRRQDSTSSSRSPSALPSVNRRTASTQSGSKSVSPNSRPDSRTGQVSSQSSNSRITASDRSSAATSSRSYERSSSSNRSYSVSNSSRSRFPPSSRRSVSSSSSTRSAPPASSSRSVSSSSSTRSAPPASSSRSVSSSSSTRSAPPASSSRSVSSSSSSNSSSRSYSQSSNSGSSRSSSTRYGGRSTRIDPARNP